MVRIPIPIWVPEFHCPLQFPRHVLPAQELALYPCVLNQCSPCRVTVTLPFSPPFLAAAWGGHSNRAASDDTAIKMTH